MRLGVEVAYSDRDEDKHAFVGDLLSVDWRLLDTWWVDALSMRCDSDMEIEHPSKFLALGLPGATLRTELLQITLIAKTCLSTASSSSC